MTGQTRDPFYGREPTSFTINDILLYLQIGTQHNCLFRGFIQQQTETDEETHSQTTGRVWKVLIENWDRIE